MPTKDIPPSICDGNEEDIEATLVAVDGLQQNAATHEQVEPRSEFVVSKEILSKYADSLEILKGKAVIAEEEVKIDADGWDADETLVEGQILGALRVASLYTIGAVATKSSTDETSVVLGDIEGAKVIEPEAPPDITVAV